MYKVLLIEDEDIIRRGLKFKMDWTAADCVVAGEASGGEEGLEKIEELRPDIVITDIHMQGISGMEMLRRSMEKYDFSAIILTGYSEFENAREAVHLGVSEYLLKPLDIEELQTAIARIIQKREGQTGPGRLIRDKTLALPEPESIRNTYARQMLDYIQENFSQKISILEVSDLLGVSGTHLNAKFKAETGYTFHDFLNYYRISKAVELQKQGKYKMYEIAEMVGIGDYKYFSKVYKKYVGYPPQKLFEESDS